MSEKQIREILACARPDGKDASDPLIAEARAKAESDPELTQWLAEEEVFDRKFAHALANTPAPFALKTRVLASARAGTMRPSPWFRKIGWSIAALAVVLVFFSSWQGPFQPHASLADYRGEMVSFIKLPPSLALESSRLETIEQWLRSANAPAQISVPGGLASLRPIGCRVLFFHGRDVTLICFRRGASRLAHLFVVDRTALDTSLKGAPVFARQDDWMTAAWEKDGRIYLLAAQGDRAVLEHCLGP